MSLRDDEFQICPDCEHDRVMRTESMEFIDEGVRKSNDLKTECRLNSLIQRGGSKKKIDKRERE